mmetsp:Transcript_5222/g.9001  ORF Transcript_5222/g.9001 Transcript_5222/m.9001 type:complete len:668 (+) Transcript_5222:230-2233(+)|eukprot:CAMPEP_0196665662 /NCGR_PEP_ID=MMETSP1086-20130531/62079_1 /TAXON_ID=77921 /ORGANISM="Cyanoptyche  gloeocystis , Strain SAG4.97" /LENGTH=667 /DNA_ID=CAMNT_0042002541 /DNA_START=227 /DNA_END=2230 /DNA_ORIENTATION=+
MDLFSFNKALDSRSKRFPSNRQSRPKAFDGAESHAVDRRRLAQDRSRVRVKEKCNKSRSESQLDEDAISLEEFQKNGRRRYVTANHLLNFTAPERPIVPTSSSSGRRRRSVQPFNKERFLVSNFRFLISTEMNSNVSDPDRMVDWDFVEQVLLKTTTPPSCPICMDVPCAAKITKCAHIFCWPCILRYLSYSDRRWRRCPLCFDAVQSSDLRSVVVESAHQYREGETIPFVLLARPKNSANVVRKARIATAADEQSSETMTNFARFSTICDLSDIVHRESLELAAARDSSTNFDDGFLPFVAEAERMLQARSTIGSQRHKKDHSASVLELSRTASFTLIPKDLGAMEQPRASFSCPRGLEDELEAWGEEEDHFAFDEGAEAEVEEVDRCSVEDTFESCEFESRDGESLCHPAELCDSTCEETLDAPALRPSLKDEDTYYFYQCADGQNIFMHPISVRCLLQEHGSFANFPATFDGTILELEHLTMDESLRRRYRQLSHLPLGSDFYFCEVDTAAHVSSDVLRAFSTELKQRWQRRIKRQREERRLDNPEQLPATMTVPCSGPRAGPISPSARATPPTVLGSRARTEAEHDLDSLHAFPPVQSLASPSSSSSRPRESPPAQRAWPVPSPNTKSDLSRGPSSTGPSPSTPISAGGAWARGSPAPLKRRE